MRSARFAHRVVAQRGLSSLLKWQLGRYEKDPHRDRPRWPEIPVRFDTATVLESIGEAPAAVWFGHASVLLRLGGMKILVDPIEGDALFVPRRAPKAPIFDLVPRPDAILITHNHYDHMCGKTLTRFDRMTPIVVPHGLAPWFSRRGFVNVRELDWWDEVRAGDARITLTPARHWSKRTIFDTNDTLWGGFVIEAGGKRAYHAGDTGWQDEFHEIGKRLGPMDVALVPIGAYAPRWFMEPAHMQPAEALDAADAVGARLIVPIHFGTFTLSDEPLTEPPAWTEQIAKERGERRLRILPIGGVVSF
ncbi:MBL fold metallo-hydrolase [bacterium]|nr:MBL fold metallo-hydrolase [bacterium]